MLRLVKSAITFIVAIAFLSANAYATNSECQTLSFSEFDAGTILTSQYQSSHGVTISADNNNGPDAALIFNSSSPTGDDFDLGTPNSAHGGPGIGHGPGAGANNTYPLGNILIIAEDVVDANNDNLVDDPDDDSDGGKLFFNFNRSNQVSYLKLIDIEQNATSTIKGYKGSTLVFSTNVSGLGDNSVKYVNLSSLATDIDKLEVKLTSSGAVDKIRHCPIFSISGTATLQGSGAPISGVSISSSALGSKTTSSNGTYEYPRAFNGTYTINASKPGYVVVSHPNPVTVSGQDVTDADFILACAEGYQEVDGECQPTYSISGTAYINGTSTPVNGVLITSSALGQKTTNSLGKYEYPEVLNGTYTLTASKTGYVVVSTPNPVVVNGASVTDANFYLECAAGYILKNASCEPVFTISGTVTLQGPGTPVSGVSITSSELGVTSTNGSGQYSYSLVFNGTYTINASKPGYQVVSHPNPVTVNNANVTDANFVLTCAQGYALKGNSCEQIYSISGTATLQGSGTPVAGVSITSSLGSTSTSTSGAYSYTGVFNGSYTLSAAKTGYQVVSHPNPVIVNNANVTDANFILACAQGYILQNGVCTEEGTPITISASDGTSTEHVEVIWTTDECAATYELFRTRTGGDVFNERLQVAGTIPATATTTQTYLDTSAVPGVIYDYAAIGYDTNGQECTRSNVDPGYRKSEINDCDGDGISDEEEIEQGTDPCDPGSFQEDLESPAFVKYNTFLSQYNFLEVQADGTEDVRVKVEVYSITGALNDEMTFELAPGEQYDADINSMAPGIDTYGLVKVSWTNLAGEESETASIEGRLTNYRPDPGLNTYSFAFTKELRNPVMGNSYATGNSIDPQGAGFTVPNWMELINLDDVSRWFTYNLYNQQGILVETHTFPLAPLSERDINGGHEIGQGVYLAEVIPHDGEAKYSMTVSRYSSNHIGGSEAKTYNFAFARLGQKGTAAKQYATITNEAGACFTPTNWVEVANTLGEAAEATVTFRDNDGLEVGATTMNIGAKSQFHFQASAILGDKALGSVEVRSNIPGALIMQSIVYYHDCASNLTQTAYLSEGRIAGDKIQQLSYNRFLGIENRLNVVNVSGESIDVLLELFEGGTLISSSSEAISQASFTQLDLNDELRFNTQADTYGVVTVETPEQRQAITEVLRLRRDPNDPTRLDFIIPTR